MSGTCRLLSRPEAQNSGCATASPSATLDVTKCHACHANGRGACQTQARHQNQPSAISATPAMQSEGLRRQVPRLPRKVKVNVTKCHACHANSRGASPDPRAPPEPVQCRKCHACQAECASMSPSATPATQSESRCRQVPRLPRKLCVSMLSCVWTTCV